MIFGRNKKPDNTESQKSTTPASQATPQSPAAPATPAAPAAASSSASPTSAGGSSEPLSAEEQELRARRSFGAKMVAASFGEIVSLLMRSATYKHFTLSDLEWLVVPPVLTQQFVLAEARKKDGDIATPVAVALWASVSEEVDKKLAANTTGPLQLRPDEWKSGDILWLIDAVGPPQVLNGIVDNLHKNVFKGRPVKVRGRDEEGNPIIKIQKLPVNEGEVAS